jgi:hypothetical protein
MVHSLHKHKHALLYLPCQLQMTTAKEDEGGGLALTGSTVAAFTCRDCWKVPSRDRVIIERVYIGKRIY